MAGGGVAEVVSSRAPGLAPGDIVFGDTGWQDYASVSARQLSKLPKIEPMTHLLSIYGIAGLTAYFGLLDVGKPKAGETVVVSAAAGSVGSIVGQIARIKGCRVVGIAGGKDKCAWLTSDLGFDAAVDYKEGAIFKALKAAAPNGIDVYFDNVGGEILEACLSQMNNHGRIACCGAISQYDGIPSAAGPRGVPGLIVIKRLIMQGFIVMDYMERGNEALRDLQSWVASGKLRVQEDVIEGLENTPKALIGLLAGENRGKRMIKV
jgi:NADPH-dependent curcumin reductase CurA